MKLHLFFVACMTLFILSCGDNSSGDKKDDKRAATLMVSNGNTSPQCQSVGMALMNYKGNYYQLDYNNQNLMQAVNMLYQQAISGMYNNTTGTSGGYNTNYNGGYNTNYNGGYNTNYNGGYNTNYNGGYNNGGYYNQQYNVVGQDECTVHFRMEFEGKAQSQNYNGGYGGYGTNYMQTMTISSFRIR
tara:strand:- start:70113 stop:70673 length:561 start_codon:yes stop_codon:yes gene_type:complete